MTALAEVDVYNLALRHVGSAIEVQSTTENTSEANTCRRFYAQVIGELLNDFPWPFAKVTVALALVESDPTTEWAYAYRYPVDCLTVRRIVGLARIESRETRIPYAIGRDENGTLIYTDWPNAVAEYTQQIDDPTQFSPTFAQAAAFKLAWYIAPSVTGGDPYKLGDRAYANYLKTAEIAKDNALDEEQPDMVPESEFIRCR